MKSIFFRRWVEATDPPVQVRDIFRYEYLIYQIMLVGLDLALTYLAFHVAFNIRFYSGWPIFKPIAVPPVLFYQNLIPVAIVIWVTIYAGLGLYSSKNLLGGVREYSRLLNAATLGMFLLISLGFLLPDDVVLARGWVILAWFLTFLFTAAGRFLARRVVYGLRKKGHFQTPALMIGVNHEGILLAEQFAHWPTSDMRLVGYVNECYDPTLDGNLKWLGKLEDLDRLIEKYEISDVILTTSALSQEQMLSLFRKYGTKKDLNLRMSSGLYEIITTGMQIKDYGTVPLVTINKVRMTGIDSLLKQLMDYAIAIPAVILLLPLMGIIALAIKLDDRGPVIYRRRVMGVNNQQFDAFKFRTMCVNSDEILEKNPELFAEYQKNFKLKDDPRITRVGKFLRKVSLDELPQLVNVLRNEMSIVGPRMITPDELSKYEQWDINLLTVKPGITGMWQVSGRSDVGYEERVRLDMFYIRNWTAWLDIQLLFQTIPAVLSRRGAY